MSREETSCELHFVHKSTMIVAKTLQEANPKDLFHQAQTNHSGNSFKFSTKEIINHTSKVPKRFHCDRLNLMECFSDVPAIFDNFNILHLNQWF